ncbi:hypothetical protein G5C51_08165 [Streptomyces sp. A7024]|uniref:Uncharacterized protein n=1 Tax=Streptomyces coryli TaxID=1128680 RepID=A0A6G4TY07_9ACTN|nr:hypothetical protein [Streptomyces coryli]NGN63881.1 hypothetical protein [Streptomyces coryli]
MTHLSPDRRPPATVHHPIPLTTEQPHAAPLAPRPDGIPDVTQVQLPDGRIVTGYTLTHTQPTGPARPAAVSPLAKNLALAGIGFAAVCGGLILLTSFITALANLVMNLIILVAVVAGLYVVLQIFGGGGGTTVNARKAIFKSNRFYG